MRKSSIRRHGKTAIDEQTDLMSSGRGFFDGATVYGWQVVGRRSHSLRAAPANIVQRNSAHSTCVPVKDSCANIENRFSGYFSPRGCRTNFIRANGYKSFVVSALNTPKLTTLETKAEGNQLETIC